MCHVSAVNGSTGSRIDQAEDIVEDIVAALGSRLQLEHLRVRHGLLLLVDLPASQMSLPLPLLEVWTIAYQQSTRHQDEDGAVLRCRLRIQGSYLMLHLLKWQVL